MFREEVDAIMEEALEEKQPEEMPIERQAHERDDHMVTGLQPEHVEIEQDPQPEIQHE